MTDVPSTDLEFVDPNEVVPTWRIGLWAEAGQGKSVGGCTAPDPILVVSAEASYHAPYDHCTVQYLQQAGVKPTWIKLADKGVRGNSHMMMVEKNNKDSAAIIADWLATTIK